MRIRPTKDGNKSSHKMKGNASTLFGLNSFHILLDIEILKLVQTHCGILSTDFSVLFTFYWNFFILLASMGLYTGVITSIVLLCFDSVYFIKNFYLSLLWFRCKKFQARNLFRVFTKSTSMAILKLFYIRYLQVIRPQSRFL